MSESRPTEKKSAELTGDEIARRQLAALERANELKMLELGVAADAPHAKLIEADRAKEAERQQLAEQRGPEQRIRLSVRVSSADAGPLPNVFVTAIAFRATAEPRNRGERDCEGRPRIQTLTAWDVTDAEQAIREWVHEQHRSTLDDLQREGARKELDALLSELDRKFTRHEVWRSCTLSTLRACVGKLIPDLVAIGAVQIVEPAQ